MKATMLYGARDIRFEERPEPTILKPTDAIVRIAATCVCGSDLWPYRGVQPVLSPILDTLQMSPADCRYPAG